ncbi:MAG: Xylose isomerase domain protein barrel [Phycisphaerales bacterium]|nr:Xylose isomerase domain protein barrel [Phycisphaerales bacterium]
MTEPAPVAAPFARTPAGLPVGFRRARSAWQLDLPRLLAFARGERFAFFDFGPVDAVAVRAARDAGLGVGTVDLLDWPALLSADAGRRRAAVVANASHVRSLAAAGVTRFLTVLAPDDPAGPRRDHFAYAVESYRSLAAAAGECGASILIEGAPGRPPHFANLGCTPADLRAFLAAVDSPAVGVNYDPSHLVRMGIDPVRFLREFADRVGHVHAKDTVFPEAERYEHGTLQQATFAAPHAYGGHAWRYALPGRGVVPWRAVWDALADVGYVGGVSIELEDEEYLTDEAAERRGLVDARDYLERG